ncbi:V/A-type H+-transporting ATPase subunit I [Methanococcus maripaludis]|uniref:A-type ATP synthase subunit I n=1 Tax=Methanococcus maripaludis TaxID=39152 RepID=A0A7J9NXS6_METMI|nr:V-type ATP synthase subunit I [Methanococcus maripaludis]MBA2850556.1 V/A-type H+-transporting ATPase subunit I [Methanococcus maripaludis]
MRPARMNKIRAVILDEKVDPVIRQLHESGLVELYDLSAKLEDPEWNALMLPAPSAEYGRNVASLTIKVSRLLDLFSSVSEGEKAGLSGVLNPKVPAKKKLSFSSSEEIISNVENVLESVEGEVSEPAKKLAELENRKTILETLKDSVKYLSGFDLDLKFLGEGSYTYVVSGLVSQEDISELESSLEEATEGYVEIVKGNPVNKSEKEQKIPVIVATLKQCADVVGAELRKSGFERLDIANVEGTPSEIFNDTEKELLSIETETKAILENLNALSKKWTDEVLVLHEVLEIEKERAEAYSMTGKTDRTHLIEAWTPKKHVKKVQEIIESASEGYAVVEVSEPDEPVEKIPVMLDNAKSVKPFEMLTEMYAPPKYNEIDPTMMIMPGFLIFYGIMLTDAVYGLLLTLAGLVLWKRMGKVSSGAYNLGYILTLSGLSTVFFGILTGGYLGDFMYQFLGMDIYTTGFALVNPLGESTYISAAKPLLSLGGIDVNNGPMAILLFSIVAGIIHLFIGLTVGLKESLANGSVLDAFLNQGMWILLILAIVATVVTGNMMIAGGAVIAVIVLCMIKGFMNGGILDALLGAMDITGFLGNVLSYARLLALCLATGGLAMAVNIMAKLLGDAVPVIGILIAVVMLVFGHSFNFVMNGLGSFIHSLRLHYVEFFGQYYEGGGKKFSPFKAKREYTSN